METEALFIY